MSSEPSYRGLRSCVVRLSRTQDLVGREMALLGEYRTRLIADIVTGKLNVREAAAKLPEVDQLSAEDDPDDNSDPEVRSDGDQVGVAGQEAERDPRTSVKGLPGTCGRPPTRKKWGGLIAGAVIH